MASNLECTLKRHNGTDFDFLYPSTSWAQIVDKPSTFTPTSHTHGNISNAGSITGDILPGTNNAYDLGSTSYRFAQMWATEFCEAGTPLANLYGSLGVGTTKTASATLALTDANKFFLINNTSASATFTIPPNSSVAFEVGTEIHFARYGATYDVIFAPGSGVTLVSEGTRRKINAQYQVATIKKVATDTWILFGALKS